jgi:hypothetical protein
VRDEHALEVLAAGFRQGVLRRLRHDDLVRLAVDHQLPAALVDVLAVLVLPDGQAPLLEQVDRRIHVAGDAGHAVLAGDAHEVVADVVKVVLQRVVAAVEVHVLVDGREAHCDRAGAVHGGLVDHGDLQAVFLRPIRCFDRRTAGGHAAAADQQIGFDCYRFKLRHFPISPWRLC